jgi:hypothetical protein
MSCRRVNFCRAEQRLAAGTSHRNRILSVVFRGFR